MSEVIVITQDDLVKEIKATLRARPYKSHYSHAALAPALTEPAAYALVLGAGFSYGIVPLVKELLERAIGDYYCYDQDQSSMERPAAVHQKDSKLFWSEFNLAAGRNNLPTVELNNTGLPKTLGAAYQCLFGYQGANALFASPEPKRKSYVGQYVPKSRSTAPNKIKPVASTVAGERFVKGFLRYVLNPGAEHGYGSPGRSKLNPAHAYLAGLLEAQQLGLGWSTCAFSRTLFTTNFDTLLQNALQMVNLSYRITDRPERGLDPSDFEVEEGPIHLVYVHGSILRHNPASTIDELGGLASKNVDVLRTALESRDVVVIGYGGWNDGLMVALGRCAASRHTVYWCDVSPEPSSTIAWLAEQRKGGVVYVHLGKGGADVLMKDLYETLVPEQVRRDPWQRYCEWKDWIWKQKVLP